MLKNEVIEFFLRQAEIGNWKNFSIEEVESKFKLEKKSLSICIPEKKYFLSYYFNLIDKKVLNSVSKEDMKVSDSEEVIQEFLMNKLDFMNKNKFAISNIMNFYNTNPKFLLINLRSSKKSIQLYLKQFNFSGNFIKKRIITKFILAIWLMAFFKWLYESDQNNISFSIIDKGIKKIKKHTNLFDQIKKQS